jgi:hypothetical protein
VDNECYNHTITINICLFAGYDLNSADAGLLKFNLTTAQWVKVSTQQPRPVSINYVVHLAA